MISLLLILTIFASSLRFLPAHALNLTPHSPIVILSNADFTSANGVTAGTGTVSDPYIIQGWNISSSTGNGISIVNTAAYVLVQNVLIQSGITGILLSGTSHVTLQLVVVSKNNLTGIHIENSSGITLTQSNVTRNGLHPLPGTGYSPGIYVDASSNVELSNNNVTMNSGSGIYLNNTHYVSVDGNTVVNNTRTASTCIGGMQLCSGIQLAQADNTTITQNRIFSNAASGLAFTYVSVNVTLKANTFVADAILLDDPVSAGFVTDAEFQNLTITPDNTVNGRPVLYYHNAVGLDIDGVVAGEVFLFNCDGVRIANMLLKSPETGITARRVHGLIVTKSVFSMGKRGLSLTGSWNLLILDNNFTNLSESAIRLYHEDTITITANKFSNVTIAVGIQDQAGPDELVYHNNFLRIGALIAPSNPYYWTQWDNGYPRGGNYYSTYNGTDNCSGPRQDICPNPDGITDQPNPAFTIDRYPLAKPFSLPSDTTPPSWPANANFTASYIRYPSYYFAGAGISLSWTSANDNVEVVAYRIYENNTLLTYVPARLNTYVVPNLLFGATYVYRIDAGDAAGNWSTSLYSSASTPNMTQNQPPPVTPPPAGGGGGGGGGGANSGSTGNSTPTWWYSISILIVLAVSLLAFLFYDSRSRTGRRASIQST